MNLTIETIAMRDGVQLRVARFEPGGEPSGVIHVVHGFGEHIDFYPDVAAVFAAEGYVTVVHEQRGFGKMPGKSLRERKKSLGITPGYAWFLDDVDTIRDRIDLWYPGLPVFLFGFSMGGNVAANYLLLRGQGRYEKVVLVSPWLRLHRPVHSLLGRMARGLGWVSARIRISAKLKHYFPDDHLFHDFISLRLYTEITDAGEYAIRHADRITAPVLLFCGRADRTVCPDAIVEFAGNAGENITLRAFPEGGHRLHMDVGPGMLREILEFYG
ncbi:MAG: lysophospholipase [Oscillospiraceae bacterium]|nr:lysophospholipase [Oscillospiraceae bacterium]